MGILLKSRHESNISREVFKNMRESKTLEYKESLESNTYMKTISAFANYDGGSIIFGIRDNGEIIGIEDPVAACLNLENKINDSIKPVPEYTLDIQNDSTIQLKVHAGIYKPYLYKGKAYKRNDSATIEVGRMEYNRLVLEGRGQSYEELPTKHQNLTFEKLGQELKKSMGIQSLNKDIMKTLELYSDRQGYNYAAELLADQNSFYGIDVIRFGDTINEIMERRSFEKISVLSQLEECMKMFESYYQYEKIEETRREIAEKIPKKAFREALANALVHRMWDIKASIKVSMYTDRIEISSPGGLPEGLGEEEYLNGQISLLRNPILGNVFFRLKYIEKFGTGIMRINYAYKDALEKPVYRVFQNSIQVILPVISGDKKFSEEEQKILYELKDNSPMTRNEIEKKTQFGKDKTIRVLNSLIEKNVIIRKGSGRGVKYWAV